jgi:hypothetical protein
MLLPCALAMAVAAMPASSTAQAKNVGPVAPELAQVEQNKATIIEDLLLKFADAAAARGHDAYWEKGRRLLSKRGASELLALSALADYETFYKVAFQGYHLNQLGQITGDLVYFPVAPCRLYDSRIATAVGLVGPMAPNTTRNISVNDSLAGQGGNAAGCDAGLNNDPPALAITLTAISPTGPGNLRTFPAGDPVPLAATLVYNTGLLTSTGTVTPSCTSCGLELSIRNQGSGSTDVAVDVMGYFQAATFGPTNGTVWAAAHITGGATPSVTRSFNLAGTAVTVSRPAVGVYIVSFGTNIQGRYYNVIPGNASSGTPLTSFANVTPAVGDPNGLFIEILDPAGTNIDTSFYVQVF